MNKLLFMADYDARIGRDSKHKSTPAVSLFVMDTDVSGEYGASIFSAEGERSVPMGKTFKMQIPPEAGYKTTRSLKAEDENVNY
jgi:hypothetical protein